MRIDLTTTIFKSYNVLNILNKNVDTADRKG